MKELPNTVEELTTLIMSLNGGNKEELRGDYRYVLYARKSTDEKGKQYRSLGDQRAECMDYARDLNLNVVEIIEEAESAKESGIRSRFDEMIKDIEKGKYDAIIAWHPDRLARNMKDAGTIIDLLDRDIIKDIKFKSFTFENTTSGKMLLGLAFVIAKEYTDKLSDDVKRGNRHNILEGKVNAKAKHGYYKDRNKYSRPDGNNFKLMKSAWEMRLSNKSLDEIADFLNENQYSRAKGTGNEVHEITKMNKKRLSDIFTNPFYAGVMVAGGQTVNLTNEFDFIPMVTPREFCYLNKIDNISRSFVLNRRVNKGIIKANLLRGKVICGHCGSKMSAGITNKKEKSGVVRRYFYYRCENKECSFNNKSIRAKVIFDFSVDYLEKNKFTTKDNYQHYLDEMSKVKEIKNNEVLRALKRGKTRLLELTKRKEQIKEYMLETRDVSIRKDYEGDYQVIKKEIIKMESEINDLKKYLTNSNESVLTYGKFLELFNNLPNELKKQQRLERLDLLLGKIFSNFTITNKKVSDFTLNSPFKEFVENGFVLVSESKRT